MTTSSDQNDQKTRLKSSNIYLLPNLITTAGLFFGFYALVSALNHQFSDAAIAILITVLLDTADGRVARLTKSATAFGAQYDSLTDVVAFGVAPAILMFQWGLASLGNLGWMCAFIYTAGVALRLARFNSRPTDLKVFVGLASPAAAIVIAATIWAVGPSTPFWAMVIAGLAVGLGILMTSNIHYWSFKQVRLTSRIPFFLLIIVATTFALVATDPPKVILLFAVAYTLFDPLRALVKLMARLRLRSPRSAEIQVMEVSKPMVDRSDQK